MADGPAGFRPNRLTVVHRLPKKLPKSHMVELGNGLHALSPEATICLAGASESPVELAKMICEACGIYAESVSNARIDLVVRELVDCGILTKEHFAGQGIYGFSDDAGRPLGMLDYYGDPLDWIPIFNRKGAYTGSWKRPPLTSVEAIAKLADKLELGDRHPVRRALEMSTDGSGSPAETNAFLLLCSGAKNGGESWGHPDLNRRISYTAEASLLAQANCCYADMFWEQGMKDLEINGEEFHSDDLGFRLSSGRTAALENMGCTVAEITYRQMEDPVLLDAMLPSLAKKLGFGLQERTVPFLRRRKALHAELFTRPIVARR